MHLKLKVGLRPVWQLDWLGWESVSHPTNQSPGESYLSWFNSDKINFLCLDCLILSYCIRVVFHSTAILLHLSRDSGWRFVFRNVLCPGTWNILCHSQLGARDCSAVVKSRELAKYLKYSLEAFTKSRKLKFKIQRCLYIINKNLRVQFASFAVIVCSRKKPGLFAFYCQQVVQILWHLIKFSYTFPIWF